MFAALFDSLLSSPLLTLSLLVSFAAYPAYAHAITQQGTRPTRPTWIMILVSDLLLFAFMLRRESNVLGSRYAVLFWCLRTVAISVVLWMLLAPMKVLVETSTTRRAVVFMTDVSGSMQTV
ncbi:MAG: hypothetical protein K2Y05_06260, partial [Hyphomicrobiaceae bacterium]|nr:hypothetical protein [Hyphomicrobiaceae bacterium]